MFDKLRNKIIIITMTITTAVLVVAGVFVMLFSSMMRPEPMPPREFDVSIVNTTTGGEQEIREYIRQDREEGNTRLVITLLATGAAIELIVFLSVYALSRKIVEPVKDSYEKQKIFIANASHELKTPLAVIEANVEALETDKKNEKWKTNIENEITHANKLVLDLLQLAKMDAGNYDKTPSEQVNLNELLAERIKIFEPKFSGKITFEPDEKESLQNLPKRDFLQVLNILLDNATKYGEKKIVVTLKDHKITVANDGAAVKAEDREKIFDRFYQTDKTKDGSGLGLSIAKTICEQNGWRIECDSQGKMTEFTLGWAIQLSQPMQHFSGSSITYT